MIQSSMVFPQALRWKALPCSLCFTFLIGVTSAHADDWSASGGITLRDARSIQPNAGTRDKGWTGNAMLTKQVDKWTLGGGLSYTLSTIDTTSGSSGRYRPATTSAVALASRDIGGGRSISATLGYGDSAVNSSQISGGTSVAYTANSNFLSASLGLTQAVTLSRRSLLILSARYTNVSGRNDPYTNTAGTTTPWSSSNLGFYTLGAGYSHRIERTTFYVQGDWNVSGKEFVPGTGDKNYFNFSTGLNYRLDAKTNLGLSFSTVAGKAYTTDNSIGASVRYAF